MKQNEKYFGDIEGVTIYFDDILKYKLIVMVPTSKNIH